MAKPILVVRVASSQVEGNAKYLKKSIKKSLGNEYNILILSEKEDPLEFEIVK